MDDMHSALARRSLRMVCDDELDYPWRVTMQPCGAVHLSYIGYLPIDGPRAQSYNTIEDAPSWVQDRVAVLNMLEPNPHTSKVFGVGRRINGSVYWVVPPRGIYGTDPRE
jgi:hypothetical protein